MELSAVRRELASGPSSVVLPALKLGPKWVLVRRSSQAGAVQAPATPDRPDGSRAARGPGHSLRPTSRASKR